jgi:hypothetical protein
MVLAKRFAAHLFRADGYIRQLHAAPGHVLPVLKTISAMPQYQENALITKYRAQVDLMSSAAAAGHNLGWESPQHKPNTAAGRIICKPRPGRGGAALRREQRADGRRGLHHRAAARADHARMNPLDRRDAWLGVMLIAPSVLIFCAVIVYPLVSAIYLSLFNIYTPTLRGNFVGLQNYAELFAGPEFWRSLANTLIWTICTLTLQVVFGIAAALMLHQAIVFRALARSLILFPYFVSTVVAVLVWRWLFNDLYGILNHMLIWAGLLDMPLDWLGSMPNAWSASCWSAPGSTSPSSSSPCWRGCRPSRTSSTRPRRSTAPVPGAGSGT